MQVLIFQQLLTACILFHNPWLKFNFHSAFPKGEIRVSVPCDSSTMSFSTCKQILRHYLSVHSTGCFVQGTQVHTTHTHTHTPQRQLTSRMFSSATYSRYMFENRNIGKLAILPLKTLFSALIGYHSLRLQQNRWVKGNRLSCSKRLFSFHLLREIGAENLSM